MWKFISTSCPALVLVAPGRDFFICKLVGAELRLPVFLSLLGENTFCTIMRLLKQGTNILSYVRI